MAKKMLSLWENIAPRNTEPAQCRVDLERNILRQIWRQELTAYQQKVVAAYYFQGKNIPQIAREMGRNKSSISRALARSRRILGERVTQYTQVFKLISRLP